MYRWDITVLEYNTYGDRVDARTPASILAMTKTEVTEKVRIAFGATYDSFRKFWSHGWVLNTMVEEPEPPALADTLDATPEHD